MTWKAKIIVGTSAVFFATSAIADVKTGLQGYWSLNGTVNDQSGNGNNLSLFGGATFATGGQFGQALSINGVEGSYAQQTSGTTDFNFGSSDFTIQVWANFASKNSEQTLLEKFTGGAGPGWTFTTPGNIQFYAGGLGAYNTAGVSFQTGVWNQFVVERNGGSISIYYNDVPVETGSISGAITSSTNPLLIGARNSGDGRNFTVDGLIDDVGIWNRALTSSEINGLWNSGNGLNLQAGVPEASTWAMLLLGFAGIGFSGYRASRKGVALTS